MDKTFYQLDIVLNSDNVEKHIVHIYSELFILKKILKFQFMLPMGVYLLIFKKMKIVLKKYEKGEKIVEIDILPYIIVYLKEYPIFRFDIDQNLIAFDKFGNKIDKYVENHDKELKEYLENYRYNEEDIQILWDKFEIDNFIDGDLKMGDEVEIFDQKIGENRVLKYGSTDIETGDHVDNYIDMMEDYI